MTFCREKPPLSPTDMDMHSFLRRKGLTMTIICCWLDDSYGKQRLTAIADARIAYKSNTGEWIPIVETTTKLFNINVRCHTIGSLDGHTGSFRDPYFETEVCIGFAGYCVEAQSIIALFSNCVENLAADDAFVSNNPRPTPTALANLLKEIIDRYFSRHTISAQQVVQFVLFGYDGNNPWIARIIKSAGNKAEIEIFSQVEAGKTFVVIGDHGVRRDIETSIGDIWSRIAKHKDSITPGNGEDAEFRHEI